MAKYDKQFADLVDKVYNTPQGKAYLRMVKASEGGEYDILFGNEKFTDMSKHPGKRKKFNDRAGGGITTAAGAYQITEPTWGSMAPRIGRNDFSAESQDRVALALALEKPGMYEAIMGEDVPKMVELSNDIYTSMYGSKEGTKRHAVHTMDFHKAAYDDKLGEFKGPVWTDKGKNFGSLSSSGYRSGVNVDFLNPALENLLGGTAGQGSFVESTIRDIQGKTYADPGNVPFGVYSGSHSVFGPMMTADDDDAVQGLVNKLFNTDPNTKYGLSFVGNGLRPTISKVDDEGNQIDMIELGNGSFINAQTGERVNEDGSTWYAEDENTDVELVDDLNTTSLPQNTETDVEVETPESTAVGVSLADSSTPPNVISETPTANTYASVNQQLAVANSADPVMQSVYADRPLVDNVKDFIDSRKVKPIA